MPSNSEKIQSISRIAGADFSGDNPGIYRFCNVGADGRVALAGAGARAEGVLFGKQIEDHAIEVVIGGRALVVLGGTVAAGDPVASDANAAAITQTSTNIVCGTALEGGVAGDVVSVLFDPQGAP